MTAPLVSVSGLEVSFGSERGPVRAVRGVDFELHSGRTLALVGESGSGKSVTALSLMGLLPETARVSGEIRLQGESLEGRTEKEWSRIRGSKIGVVFQDPLSSLTPIYTVGRQVADAVRVHQRVSRAQALERAKELLDLVGIPEPQRRAFDFPHQFSGGMRQRVSIAIAIANDPDLIIADEPTTALDVTVQAQVLNVLEVAKEETGAGVLLITHDLGVVAGHADEVAVMKTGEIVERGEVHELFAHPREPYTVRLLESVPRPDAESRQPFKSLGDEPSVAVAEKHLDGNDEVVRVDDLVKTYPITKGSLLRRRVGTLRAVDGISFRIREGETFCLVGESGSGKTTTLLELMELKQPEQGTIRVLGRDVAELRTKDDVREMRQAIQIVTQDPATALDPRLPVFELLAEPLRAAGWKAGPTQARVVELLDLVGLPADSLERFPAAFSGGQRQRLSIARALATRPKLIVLDEPVSALDVSVQADILNLLAHLQRELGLTYLIVSHDLAVVRHIADTIAVMYLGKVVETGDVDDVFLHPQHPYTKALISAAPIPDPVIERNRERSAFVADDEPGDAAMVRP